MHQSSRLLNAMASPTYSSVGQSSHRKRNSGVFPASRSLQKRPRRSAAYIASRKWIADPSQGDLPAKRLARLYA
jgi:hypothetical protein